MTDGGEARFTRDAAGGGNSREERGDGLLAGAGTKHGDAVHVGLVGRRGIPRAERVRAVGLVAERVLAGRQRDRSVEAAVLRGAAGVLRGPVRHFPYGTAGLVLDPAVVRHGLARAFAEREDPHLALAVERESLPRALVVAHADDLRDDVGIVP